ncbi:hypothetical protein BDK51DRAFT_37609 [Blyttiomyces helicus]|uniref:Uncharacterized protein n=1 Tax=Blyttiomyces helicus TaxID=388810 RepID=A0A4P9WCF9_9FUNG|nr:hypothetical protein BDK51DRAFT_37609 [Blyttiomyces helicus]|eukprot:RKO88898.1 hypothetical protein BDK51DRAFT_37609 [Blyttiomyces helicus]
MSGERAAADSVVRQVHLHPPLLPLAPSPLLLLALPQILGSMNIGQRAGGKREAFRLLRAEAGLQTRHIQNGENPRTGPNQSIPALPTVSIHPSIRPSIHPSVRLLRTRSEFAVSTFPDRHDCPAHCSGGHRRWRGMLGLGILLPGLTARRTCGSAVHGVSFANREHVTDGRTERKTAVALDTACGGSRGRGRRFGWKSFWGC